MNIYLVRITFRDESVEDVFLCAKSVTNAKVIMHKELNDQELSYWSLSIRKVPTLIANGAMVPVWMNHAWFTSYGAGSDPAPNKEKEDNL